MGNDDLFKKSKVIASFSAFAFIAGFIFLNKSLTGNVILTPAPSFNSTSLIGLLLIFCSAILAFYTIKNK